MTFADLVGVVKDYCNLSSPDAVDRIGRSVNRHYKRVTASLGLDAVRHVTRSATTTNGQQYVIFTEIEYIARVIDTTDSTAIRLLPEISLDLQRTSQPGTSQPTTWALRNTDADSVTILLDTLPQTTYSLQADGTTTVTTLAGNDEPVFPESYHDILSWYVIAEELLRKEKADLSEAYAARADRLLSELRHYLADSPSRDTRQAAQQALAAPGASGGGGSVGGTAYTQSALLTFEQNTLRLLDTDETHGVTVNIGSNLTAERALSLVTGDADRTITLSGSPTLDNWFDQSVKTSASPTFVSPIASTSVIVGATTTSGIRLDLESGTLAVREGDDSAYGPVKALTLEATTSAAIGTSATVGTTATVGTAVIVGTADTSGIRLDLETGTLAVREGDDSAYGPVKALAVESTTTTTVGTIATVGTAVAVGTNPATTGGIRLANNTPVVARNAANGANISVVTGGADNKVYVGEATTDSGLVLQSATSIAVSRGVGFPAVQVASSDANTLDDYEEGTWTPVIGGAGGTSGQAYTAQAGHYVKLGRLVILYFNVLLSTEGTITGNAELQGLPFPTDNVSNHAMPLTISYFSGLAVNYVNVGGFAAQNASVAALYGLTAAAAAYTALTAADIGNTTQFVGSLTYKTSA